MDKSPPKSWLTTNLSVADFCYVLQKKRVLRTENSLFRIHETTQSQSMGLNSFWLTDSFSFMYQSSNFMRWMDAQGLDGYSVNVSKEDRQEVSCWHRDKQIIWGFLLSGQRCFDTFMLHGSHEAQCPAPSVSFLWVVFLNTKLSVYAGWSSARAWQSCERRWQRPNRSIDDGRPGVLNWSWRWTIGRWACRVEVMRCVEIRELKGAHTQISMYGRTHTKDRGTKERESSNTRLENPSSPRSDAVTVIEEVPHHSCGHFSATAFTVRSSKGKKNKHDKLFIPFKVIKSRGALNDSYIMASDSDCYKCDQTSRKGGYSILDHMSISFGVFLYLAFGGRWSVSSILWICLVCLSEKDPIQSICKGEAHSSFL